MPFDDEQQAYRLANATEYGLTAGVFSRSPRTVARAVRALEAGNIYVNRSITGSRVGVEPFGGMWMSGTGPKAGGPDYLWAFTRRADAADAGDPSAGAGPAATAPVAAALPAELAKRWDAPFERRVAVVEGAAALLGARGEAVAAGRLLDAAQSARRELDRALPTLPVAGQHNELRFGPARGLGLVHATGADAAWWLAAPLLAGNAVCVVASPALAPVVDALREAGAPPGALAAAGDAPGALLTLAESPDVAFVATDAAGALADAVYRRLGPTAPRQRSLKALLSPLDGPQPREPGFPRRFAWAKAVAVRTLRHGADLALDEADDRG